MSCPLRRICRDSFSSFDVLHSCLPPTNTSKIQNLNLKPWHWPSSAAGRCDAQQSTAGSRALVPGRLAVVHRSCRRMPIATVSTVGHASCVVSALKAPKRARTAPRAVLGIVASHNRPTTGAPRRAFIRKVVGVGIGIAAIAAAPTVDPSVLLDAPAKVWDAYQTQLTANPIATKAIISGVVYFVGDLIAQAYEGLTDGAVDTARAVRSGLCGLLAHGPLSHFWYLFCDNAIAELPVSPHAWYVPLLKIFFDQTVWSATWNGTYYGLLGVLRREPPAVIAESVRTSCLDLMMAGWKLWPAAHLVTYGLIAREHRLLWVDTVEILWVIVLSTYGQHQREVLAAADAALVHVEPALAEQLVPQEVPVAAVPALPAAE